MNDPAVERAMLKNAKSIAVIGLSEDAAKPSHYVSRYMQKAGYKIYPVNPAITEVLGEKSYASLRDLPEQPDIVNVFRLPKFIPAIVDEMISLGWKNIWLQKGIIDEASAARAEQAGINVIMDRCIMVEHQKL